MKKLSKILLIFVMLFSVILNVNAEDKKFSITITNAGTGHEYKAYQIFSGTVDTAEGSTALGQINWGTGVNSSGLLQALKNSTVQVEVEEQNDGGVSTTTKVTVGSLFTTATTAADVADVMSNYANDSDMAKAFAQIIGEYVTGDGATFTYNSGNYVVTNLSGGYYFIKDVKSTTPDDYFYTRYILMVAKDQVIPVKGAVPTVKHTVSSKKIDDAEVTAINNFTVTGTLPNNYSDYSTYKYVFTITLDTGLTYVANSAEVSIGGTKLTENFTLIPQGNVITVTFDNLKKITNVDKDSKIVITYKAYLNSTAVIGNTGNSSTVVLQYSADPNQNRTDVTSNTTASTAKLVTYALDITKVSGAETTRTLAGASFKLYKEGTEKEYATIDANGYITGWVDEESATVITTAADGKLNIKGLDSGTYYLEETNAPDGFNIMNDATLVITSTLNQEDQTITTAKLVLTQDEVDDPETLTATNGVFSLMILNQRGGFLPSTGGIGTTLFYVIGFSLIGFAFILIFVKRKKDEDEQENIQ